MSFTDMTSITEEHNFSPLRKDNLARMSRCWGNFNFVIIVDNSSTMESQWDNTKNSAILAGKIVSCITEGRTCSIYLTNDPTREFGESIECGFSNHQELEKHLENRPKGVNPVSFTFDRVMKETFSDENEQNVVIVLTDNKHTPSIKHLKNYYEQKFHNLSIAMIDYCDVTPDDILECIVNEQ